MKNIAVIGLGNIAKRHRKNIRLRFPISRIYALSSSGRKVDEVVDDCDVLCESIEDLLCINLDFVIVASPASHHALYSLPFINLSIPVLIEKPLSTHSEDLKKLLEARALSDSVACVAYCLRYSDTLLTFKSMIDNNRFGQIHHITMHVGQDLNDWRPGVCVENTVSVSQQLGGGVLNELSHELDYMQWIFGTVEPHSALLTHSNRFNMNVEDMADVLLFNPSGIPLQLHLDFHQQVPQRFCQLICDQGRIDVDLIKNTITQVSKNGSICLYEKQQSSPNDKYLAMLDDFVAHVEGDPHSCISLAEGGLTVSLIETIKSDAKVCVQ
jgi:predicted dehydrogenase